MKPRIPNSPPAMPAMILSLSGSGGLVMLKPCIGSAICTSQSSAPVRASSASSAASSVPTNRRLPRIATPRLNGLISFGLRTFCVRW